MPNMQSTKTPVHEQEPKVRARNFEEVSSCYTDDEALNEANRCLNCKNMPCVSGCPVGVRIPEFIAKIRAGDIAGTQQSGMAFDLKIANPTLDVQILQLTRDAAGGVLAADAALAAPEHAGLRELKRRYSGEKSIDFSMIS